MDSLLHVQNLTVRYGADGQRPKSALCDVDFELAGDEALGLLGESGSGKTTLALALLGLLPPGGSVERGAIWFRGTNLVAAGPRVLRKIQGAEISLVHQEPALALNPVMRVADQVIEVLRAHQHLTGQQARAKSLELLAEVGFAPESGITDAFPHQLSGGQRQRVVIAQAIACRPALIVADEPTTALDTAAQREILVLLRDLHHRMKLALILISHDPAVLAAAVQRILVMYAGRIVEDGPAAQLLQNPSHPYTRGLLRCGLPVIPGSAQGGRFDCVPGEPPDLAALSPGCAFAPRCPERMEVCGVCAPAETRLAQAHRVWCFKYE